ncbi:transcriptional regulator, XRE family [Methanolobus vulcani]|jgi:putative transcription factor|uniref:Transcriptional regulator, XRE family n=1 Tax=Methanolobus vulcani TaxID=38026 RepID=A0A7Z7AYJ0_9EURY|nr:multiprotein bridging factor aMBF1 [Methanolobus vulcani]MDK2824835.1 putative transcription factor [Methanolobus sp.]SDF49691.1 transcriptional regulator, XRE family [Methanolobus vulcani]
MQCEICGAEIRGDSFKVNIDGSELTVCGRCSQYGTAAGKRSPVSKKIAPVSRRPASATGSSRPPRKAPGMIVDELIDEYGQAIKEARERKKWSHDQLASKIKEKATLVKKIEREEIVPEDDVRQKIEKALDLKLTERTGDNDWSGERLNRGTTLGDIVTIKRK